MKSKSRATYTDDQGEIVGELKQVRDDLPTPEELADEMPSTKITIALDNFAIAYFKKEASKHGTKYQRMIRNLVSTYAGNQLKIDPRGLRAAVAGRTLGTKMPAKGSTQKGRKQRVTVT